MVLVTLGVVMRTSSAKAKGRRLQDWVRAQVVSLLGLPEDTDLVRTAIMGESGADVQVSSHLRGSFPFSIECKNQEKYKTLYNNYDQAKSHDELLEPLLFIKMNHRPPLVVMDATEFFNWMESLHENPNP